MKKAVDVARYMGSPSQSMSTLGPSISAPGHGDAAELNSRRYTLAPMMPGGNAHWHHFGKAPAPAPAPAERDRPGIKRDGWGRPEPEEPSTKDVVRRERASLVTGVILANPANRPKTRRKPQCPTDQADMLTHDQTSFVKVLDPYSMWRMRWNLFTLGLIGYVLIVTPFEIAFVSNCKRPPGGMSGLWVCNLLVDLSFLADMCLTFNTAYFNAERNTWIMDRRYIALEYLRMWFLIDLVSIFPFEYVGGENTRYFRIMRVFKLSKLLRAVKSYRLLAHIAKHIDFILNLFIMLMGCFILALLLGELTNTVSNLDPVTNNFRRTLDNLNDYMARSNFPEKLRLKLREYIMLSENIFRDNYYKEILDQLSPNLLAVVAVQNFGEVVCRIPFVAYTVQAACGIRLGSVVTVHSPDWVPGTKRKKSQPALTRTARIIAIPKYLCYNVRYLDNSEEEENVDNSRVARVERKGPGVPGDAGGGIMDRHHLLHYEYAQFTVTLAKLLTSQLFMATDTIVHRYLSMNDALYVIESGNVKLFGRKSPRLYDVEIRQTNEFFGDDISMVVAAESEFKPVLRHYTARAGRITQLLVMDAEKLHTVLQSPSFALFSHHIKKYGRWMRLKLIGDGGDSGDGVDSGDMLGTPRLGNYAEAGAPWPAAARPRLLGEATASVVNKLVAEVLSKSDADRADFAAKRPETAALVAQLARSLERDASAATWSGGESYQASPPQNLRTVEFDHGGSAAGSPPTPPVLSNGVGDNFDPNSPAALHGFSLLEPAGDADEDKAYSFCGAFGDQPGGGGGGGGTA
ncbi:phosphorelay sensor kinase [Aureococcus anophagefferens]|nr:phosphorelay sensor kinase [Aureococcus anophagefferens]